MKQKIPILFAILLLACPVWAHEIVGESANLSTGEAALTYLKLGFKHIIPLGWDHILFILGLFFLNPRLKPILWQSLAFTIAHSITLCLATLGFVRIPSSIIEPLIAATIIVVALQNIFNRQPGQSRLWLVFVFGLIHGFGFAGVLGELGLPSDDFAISLFMFNLGVEIGQLTVILLAFFLVGKWFRDKWYYQDYIVKPQSLIIACLAMFWFVQRI